MELSKAKEILNACVRSELRDHAFGDVEVYWIKDGIQIAVGYFGGNDAQVWFLSENMPPIGSFKGNEARRLRECGIEGKIERNDETGPDEFVVGQVMPGLTKAGVLEEITTIRDPGDGWDSNGDLW